VLSGRGWCDGQITCREDSYECLSALGVGCFQFEVFATGWSLVKCSPMGVLLF